MLKSKVKFVNNRPLIEIDGKNYPPMAYTTYFDECGQWTDFINSGYRMFFVNVSFTELPINNMTGFTPFRTGVFEKDEPDYSEFDGIVRGIVEQCPDALIFPRVNIAMPRRWTEENPDETVKAWRFTRESMYSDVFRRDGARLLEILISHIRSSDYADRIAGYQICGGITQEWMHHDLFSSYSAMGMRKFSEWAKEKYGIDDIKIPSAEELEKGEAEEILKYYEFCNEKNAQTVEFFAKAAKELTDNQQIVGVFYGYNGFVNAPLYGLHGLRHIVDSPYIDFFSSPCAYDGNRQLGMDWGDMLPVDSLKLHGKLCFIECDIRTHLTKRMQDSRPGMYPDGIYTLYDDKGNKTVWCGPDTCELSVSAIRKAFMHQMSKASGIWWFDMWGGWYHDEAIMKEAEEINRIYSSRYNDAPEGLPCNETVLFIDEKAYSNIKRGSPLMNTVNGIRVAMGNTGIPFDTYMVEDAPYVAEKYKAAIFTAPFPSQKGIEALELCRGLGMHCIASTEEKPEYSTAELRELLTGAGIHCYNSQGNVIYCSGNYIAVHTASEGKATIKLPGKFVVSPCFSETTEEYEANELVLEGPRHATYVFRLIRA